MSRARKNPLIDERLLGVKDRIYRAVDEGLRELVDRKTLAKIFRPVPRESVGSVATEMDLLRLVAGDWARTGKPYEACNFTMPQYLAFAYCAERVLLAAGETEAAGIFAFIRSAKDAKKVVAGYPSKGGLSRILQWYRDHGPLGANDSAEQLVHSTTVMLTFDSPLDTLLFARSELFPIEKWSDGWNDLYDSIRRKTPNNGAWRRGAKEGVEIFNLGLLVAGMYFGEITINNRNMENADMNGVTAEKLIFDGCSLSGSSLSGDIEWLKYHNCELGSARIGPIKSINDLNIESCSSRDMVISGFDRGIFFVDSRCLHTTIEKCGRHRARFYAVDCVMPDTVISNCGFRDISLGSVNARYLKIEHSSTKGVTNFVNCEVDMISVKKTNTKNFSFALCKAKRLGAGLKEWKIVDGNVVRNLEGAIR